jgi:hypothetical protein
MTVFGVALSARADSASQHAKRSPHNTGMRQFVHPNVRNVHRRCSGREMKRVSYTRTEFRAVPGSVERPAVKLDAPARGTNPERRRDGAWRDGGPGTDRPAREPRPARAIGWRAQSQHVSAGVP